MAKKKKLAAEEMPEFYSGLNEIDADSRIFIDKSLAVAENIHLLLEKKGMLQKELAATMGKTEAELSKLMSGMHNYTLRSIAKLESALGATLLYTHEEVETLIGNLMGVHVFLFDKKEKWISLNQHLAMYPASLINSTYIHNQPEPDPLSEPVNYSAKVVSISQKTTTVFEKAV
jgi:transcriptional regulator with XRE-family HTH domain